MTNAYERNGDMISPERLKSGIDVEVGNGSVNDQMIPSPGRDRVSATKHRVGSSTTSTVSSPTIDTNGESNSSNNNISTNSSSEFPRNKLINPSDGVQRRIRKSRMLRSKTAVTEHPSATAILIKYAALFLLVAQMVGLVLLMRYSRTVHDPNQPLYLASTAVFIMEVMKFVMCLLVIAYQSGRSVFSDLWTHTVGSPMEVLKLCVPSLLYTIQNNLLYLALTNLDAATYQVCYQLKILTTALFSVVLLGRKFSPIKWMSLLILTAGVAVVELSGSADQHTSTNHPNDELATSEANRHNRWVGLLAVLFAACTSGFSGVYFEKILKGSTTSLWIRNVQMGIPSILIAYITVYIKDGAAIRTNGGMLQGYNRLVWIVVIVQAVGGLIVATVVKYADNVLKVFATSFSIVVSCIFSAFLFDFHPTMAFVVGASLVVTATVMYSTPETKVRPKRIAKPILPMTTHHRPASKDAHAAD
jgi:solute carrier family 35 (UDP-sugar transporter), member A1/2/3